MCGSDQFFGVGYEWMIKSSGVGVERGGLQTKLSPGFAPLDDDGEDFAENGFGGGRF